MENEIIAYAAKLASDYTFTADQRENASRNKYPEKTKERLPDLLRSLRTNIAGQLGVHPGIVRNTNVMGLIDFKSAFRAMNSPSVIDGLHWSVVADIARRDVMSRPLALIYQFLLGREMDPAGRDFYQGLMDRGEMTSAGVIEDIVKNIALGAK